MGFSTPKLAFPPTTPFLLRRDPIHFASTPHRFAFLSRRLCIIAIACVVSLLVAAYFVWPSAPDLKISRLKVNSLNIRTAGHLFDLSLGLMVKVKNHDLYTMDYRTVDVAIRYRGTVLGHVKSNDGHLRPLGTSDVNADVEVDGTKVLKDVVFLLEDLLKGSILLDTVMTIHGRLGVLLFDFPFKAKISCELIVNTRNRTVDCGDCHSGD
ncbi:hypothetical protein MLD38_007947 [Melastoma candidum]|uniref:Uncharacterized protein n=1 Tax=Melastoma candidum TaxID=119954 RepID=A0ACB9RS73_9MYRT|nr:hypothetical protein MLD38_007947 [Melastoma candidum]